MASRVVSWFSAFGGKRKVDADKKEARSIRTRDATGTIVANVELLDGLYYGEIPALQLASPLALVPANTPVSLIGIPMPTADDDVTKGRLKRITTEYADDFPTIERTKLIHGTAWRWARYDAKNMKAVWESIPDDSIEALEVDVVSGEIVAIYTHDIYNVSIDRDKTKKKERYRKITRERINVKWVGGMTQHGNSTVFGETSSVNPFGHMPRPFGHDCKDGAWRGHSVYGRNLRLFKAYHEVMLQQIRILAEFNPKLVHNVSEVKEWMKNNGYTGIDQVDEDVFSSRFFLNKMSEEKTEMVYLSSDATKSHDDALDRITRLLISGSNVPELFWGGLATGNAASTDTQKDQVVQYIQSLQTEDSTQYEGLFNDTLEILSFVEMWQYSKCKMSWDKIDMLSEETKAKVLNTVAAGIGTIVTTAGGTKDDIYFLWKKFYPDLPEKDIEAFVDGIKETAKHKAFSNTDAVSQSEYA
jgi:hypothetical protein